MKTIKFTNKEIELLKKSLQWAYNTKMAHLAANRVILSDMEIKSLLKSANQIDDLNTKI